MMNGWGAEQLAGARRLHVASAASLVVATAFLAFFLAGKVSPFREINPFGEDPYDAVGSIAVQLALFCGVLSYARALRLLHGSQEMPKARFVIRGDGLVLTATLATLVTDAAAETPHQVAPSYWESVLLCGLIILGVLTLVCAGLLARAASLFPVVTPPSNLTPADAIDDLLSLLRVPLAAVQRVLPAGLPRWVQQLTSDRLFAYLPFLNPRIHPWRFAAFAGVSAGLLLLAFQLREGLPASFLSGIAVGALFVLVELAATLAGFALFGGFLGLRP